MSPSYCAHNLPIEVYTAQTRVLRTTHKMDCRTERIWYHFPITHYSLSQVLANFIMDFTPNVTPRLRKSYSISQSILIQMKAFSRWFEHVNISNIGLVLTLPEGNLIQQAIRCGFHAKNNEAEYEELIARLILAKGMGIKKIDICSNSQLVVNQLLGTYQARDLKMASYLDHVKTL